MKAAKTYTVNFTLTPQVYTIVQMLLKRKPWSGNSCYVLLLREMLNSSILLRLAAMYIIYDNHKVKIFLWKLIMLNVVNSFMQLVIRSFVNRAAP